MCFIYCKLQEYFMLIITCMYATLTYLIVKNDFENT